MTIDTPTMRHRFAGQSAIEELLRVQGGTPPRSGVAQFFGRSPLGADSVAWYVGAKGEQVVGAILEALPPVWTVFHALPVGPDGADIDHVVVGPAGVFTISSKHHHHMNIVVSGRNVLVAGQRRPCIPDAEAEAASVSALMRERMPRSTSARPVVAIVHPRKLTMTEKPAQVKVIDAKNLRDWLVALPPVLAWPERMELNAVIDSPATWRAEPGAEPGVPPEDLPARFAALDADVRAARIRRGLWRLLGIGAAASAVIIIVSELGLGLVQLLTSG
ncbi:MAG TPA: nuclease-related domain-containing protein [Cryobacterium sp.]|nr:nuclease-related domain-containing protein [Cryobacterium sp.]